jgi:hypothetical protein
VARVILIGYWRSNEEPEWPDPHDFVDETWDLEERALVADYLRDGFIPWMEMGFSWCRICGMMNGSAEYADSVYLWPEGLSHYIEEHAVRLPRVVVSHVLTRVASVDDHTSTGGRQWDDVDRDWWRDVGPEDT